MPSSIGSAPPMIRFWVQYRRDQRAQRGGGVADQVDLVGVAHPDHRRVEVDLHGLRLVERRHELGVRKAGPDGEQRVAAHHHLVAGAGAEQADRARHPRQLVAEHVLAQQRLRYSGAQEVGHPLQLDTGAPSAGAGQDRHPLAGVEQVGRAADSGVVRCRRGPLDPHARRHHLELVRGGCVLQLLHVRRNDHGGRRAAGRRDPIARSSTLGSCSGTVTICTNSLATSLNSDSRSTSCW